MYNESALLFSHHSFIYIYDVSHTLIRYTYIYTCIEIYIYIEWVSSASFALPFHLYIYTYIPNILITYVGIYSYPYIYIFKTKTALLLLHHPWVSFSLKEPCIFKKSHVFYLTPSWCMYISLEESRVLPKDTEHYIYLTEQLLKEPCVLSKNHYILSDRTASKRALCASNKPLYSTWQNSC